MRLGPSLGDARDMARWWPLTAFWVAGWLVSHTSLPSTARNVLALLLVAVPVALLLAVAHWTDFELTGGRCRAENKTDDERCSLHRPPNRDLCHVHRRTHGVTLVGESSDRF